MMGAFAGNGGGVADWALGLGAGAMCLFFGSLGACAALGGTPLIGVPLFPIGAWLVAGIFSEAARDLREGTPLEWAGMTYNREAR